MAVTISTLKSHPSLFRAIGLVAVLGAIGSVAQLAGSSPPQAAPHVHLGHAGVAASNDEWNGGPRECDLAAGIDTACIFQD
jgi:hypothetical protein